MSRARPLALVVAILCAAALGRAATADAAELFYGVDTQNRLVSFTGDGPSSITRRPFTGLAAGEQIVGLDVRPAGNQLYALSSASRLYRVDPVAGGVTSIGTSAFAPALGGTTFGFDFNPTVDRIRVTGDGGQNLRLNPETGGTAAVDGTLAYAAGDAGAGATPRIVASAYTNSVAGATTTQLYNLDAARNTLVLQNPPNNGTLVTVGPLGAEVGDVTAFDIAPSDGTAYAALELPGNRSSQLYRINLTTGTATAVGRIGGGTQIRALATAGTAAADTQAPVVAIAGVTAPTRVAALARSGIRVRATCSEGCTFAVRLVLGTRVVGTARAVTTDLAASTALRVVFSTAGKKLVAGRRTVSIKVIVSAEDAAGNASNATRTIRARV
jgi:Domain of unknown function (DUF4394)